MAGTNCWRRRQLGVCLALALLWGCLAGAANADFAADQQECADSLIGLMTCLDFVEGSSPSPPPDCCSGLKQVVGKSLKCLCILIKDRNEPQLPFKVNATRAATLPSVCKSPVNVAQCIDLLKLDPNSEDAQIFKQYGSLSNNTTKAIKTPSVSGGASAGTPTGGVGEQRRPAGGFWAASALAALSLVIFGGS